MEELPSKDDGDGAQDKHHPNPGSHVDPCLVPQDLYKPFHFHLKVHHLFEEYFDLPLTSLRKAPMIPEHLSMRTIVPADPYFRLKTFRAEMKMERTVRTSRLPMSCMVDLKYWFYSGISMNRSRG